MEWWAQFIDSNSRRPPAELAALGVGLALEERECRDCNEEGGLDKHLSHLSVRPDSNGTLCVCVMLPFHSTYICMSV